MNKMRKKFYCLAIFILIAFGSGPYVVKARDDSHNPIYENINHNEIINQGFQEIKSKTNNEEVIDYSFNFSFYKILNTWLDSHPMIEFSSFVENTITIKFIDGIYKLLINSQFSNNEDDREQINGINGSFRIFIDSPLEEIGKKALILNPSEYMYGGRHCNKIINILLNKGYCIEYLINNDVDIPYIRDRLQAELIYINTHGGYWDLDGDNQGDVVVIASGERWTNETQEEYKFEFENQMIVEGLIGDHSYVAFTPSFIQYYYQEKELPDSIVYMATCYSSFDESMAEAFLISGANVYVGWKRDTISWTNSHTSIKAFRLMALGIPVRFVCFMIGYGGLFNFLLKSRLTYYGNGFQRI